MPIQTISVTAADPITFINRVIELASQGAVLKEKTFPRLQGKPFALQMEIEVEGNSEIPKAPGINPLPVPLSEKVYSKEELDSMSWEQFKKAVKAKGIGGRDRDVMVAKYLQATNQV
jgi:hypothetical protein